MTERPFTEFLQRSFALIERELPWGYTLIEERLRGREVSITVDTTSLAVLPDAGRLLLRATGHNPSVVATTTHDVIVALLEGRCNLHEAVREERVLLVGELEDLVVFDEALETYFRCAVRCRSMPRLLDEYVHAARQKEAV